MTSHTNIEAKVKAAIESVTTEEGTLDIGKYDHELLTELLTVVAEESRREERERIKVLLENILVIDVNPSNDDQRDWYRGLGREEAQRETREKALKALTPTNHTV